MIELLTAFWDALHPFDGAAQAIGFLPLLAAGAGLGLASSLFGPDEETSTSTTTLDPQQQTFLNTLRQRLLSFQGGQQDPGEFDQLTGALSGLLPGLETASQTGLGGLGEFFDPFQDEVIAGIQGDFGRRRDQARRSAADQAVATGAFGGSRSAVLEAEQLRNLDEVEANTVGRFRSAGFNNAVANLMAERARLGQLGLAGAGGLFNVGQARSGRELDALRLLGLGIGPNAGTTRTTTPLFNNPLAGALGGAATFGGLFQGNG